LVGPVENLDRWAGSSTLNPVMTVLACCAAWSCRWAGVQGLAGRVTTGSRWLCCSWRADTSDSSRSASRTMWADLRRHTGGTSSPRSMRWSGLVDW